LSLFTIWKGIVKLKTYKLGEKIKKKYDYLFIDEQIKLTLLFNFDQSFELFF